MDRMTHVLRAIETLGALMRYFFYLTLVVALIALLMDVAGAATLNPGQSMTITCKASGTPQPPTKPQPPKPEPKPPAGCKAPTYPIAETGRLTNGFERIKLHNNATVVRTVNSRFFTGTGTLSSGPYGSSDHFTTFTITKCPGNLDLKTIDRRCWGSSDRSTVRVSTGPDVRGVCPLEKETDYFVNLTPAHPTTGKGTCNRGTCESTFISRPQ